MFSHITSRLGLLKLKSKGQKYPKEGKANTIRWWRPGNNFWNTIYYYCRNEQIFLLFLSLLSYGADPLPWENRIILASRKIKLPSVEATTCELRQKSAVAVASHLPNCLIRVEWMRIRREKEGRAHRSKPTASICLYLMVAPDVLNSIVLRFNTFT